jgi:hypothetical protein
MKMWFSNEEDFENQNEVDNEVDTEEDSLSGIALNKEEEVESDSEEDESSDEETPAPPSNLLLEYNLLREDRRCFHSKARELFLDEWLGVEGDWLKKLGAEHLHFLRDILDIPFTNTSPPTWPIFTPRDSSL